MLSRNRFERDFLLTAVRVPMAAAAALGVTVAFPAFAQSPAPSYPPAPAYPQQPAPGYQQPAPGYQQPPAPGYQPPAQGYPQQPAQYPQQQPPPGYPQQQPPPGYPQQPPPGYQQQPGYQQPAPGYQQPPPGYQPPPPGYQPPPPGYQQPGYPPPQPPAYGQPGYGQQPQTYPNIPLPPPPQRSELKWSVRFNIFDLLFGRATAELEYAIAGPLSLTIAPQYIFGDPRQDRNLSVTARGYGFYGELGLWVQGSPLRGYYLKGHFGHAAIKFKSEVDADVDAPETRLGILFGSQSIYGGWFTLNGGFGIAYDTQSEDRYIRGRDTRDGSEGPVLIPASGLFGNGWNLLSQISLGGSF